jgi:hypothetical protein
VYPAISTFGQGFPLDEGLFFAKLKYPFLSPFGEQLPQPDPFWRGIKVTVAGRTVILPHLDVLPYLSIGYPQVLDLTGFILVD